MRKPLINIHKYLCSQQKKIKNSSMHETNDDSFAIVNWAPDFCLWLFSYTKKGKQKILLELYLFSFITRLFTLQMMNDGR